jgi:hypothetical protein
MEEAGRMRVAARQLIILDTNVLGALMRALPDAAVVAWLDRQPADSVWITSITFFESVFRPCVTPITTQRTAAGIKNNPFQSQSFRLRALLRCNKPPHRHDTTAGKLLKGVLVQRTSVARTLEFPSGQLDPPIRRSL